MLESITLSRPALFRWVRLLAWDAKLKPAPTTVPIATHKKQHNHDDGEKRGGIHIALLTTIAIDVVRPKVF